MKKLIAILILALAAGPAFAQHDHGGRTHMSFKRLKQGPWLMIVWDHEDKPAADIPETTFNKYGYEFEITNLRVVIYAPPQRSKDLSAKIEFKTPAGDRVIGANAGVARLDFYADTARHFQESRKVCQEFVGLPAGSPFLTKNDAWTVVNPVTRLPLCGEPIGDLEALNKIRSHVDASIRPIIKAKDYDLANNVLKWVWPK